MDACNCIRRSVMNESTTDQGPLFELELESYKPGPEAGQPQPEPRVPAPELTRLGSVAIHKSPFHVRLGMNDGSTLEGEVFLTSEPGQSTELALQHFLSELGEGFFPLREADGRTAIVAVGAVRWLAAPLEQDDEQYAEPCRVRVHLGGGQSFEGVVRLDIATISPRVSDLLNEPRPYLALQAGREFYLLHRCSIVRVYDLGKA
jgi:hypothetical protein